MTKPYPALCRDCKHSQPSTISDWNLRCINPVVNARDSWALAAVQINGSDARSEREKRIFAACGMKGKLWEPK